MNGPLILPPHPLVAGPLHPHPDESPLNGRLGRPPPDGVPPQTLAETLHLTPSDPLLELRPPHYTPPRLGASLQPLVRERARPQRPAEGT